MLRAFSTFIGIFAPLSKISKPLERHKTTTTKKSTPVRPPRRIDLSRITSKINTGEKQAIKVLLLNSDNQCWVCSALDLV